jgi:hypothetical protein
MAGLRGAFPTIRLGVIDDARGRQRRRRRIELLAAIGALVAGVILFAPRADEPTTPPRAATPPPPAGVPWRTVLTSKPFMGASCPTPNSTACGRFGVAVWLKRPARAVEATILDRHFALDNRQWSGPVHAHKRKMFAGFVREAGLGGKLGVPPGVLWEGDPIPYVLVRLRIDYGRGAPVLTQARVPLRPGWG